MELVEVEIIGMVITARYGTLNTGAILRTDAAFAKHLVDDCSAAKYTKVSASPAPAMNEDKKPRQKREKSKEAETPPLAQPEPAAPIAEAQTPLEEALPEASVQTDPQPGV